MSEREPTVDDWLERLAANPSELSFLSLPLLRDLEACLAARAHEREDPAEPRAYAALVAAAALAQVRGAAERRRALARGALRDWQVGGDVEAAGDWLGELGLEATPDRIEAVIGLLASAPAGRMRG